MAFNPDTYIDKKTKTDTKVPKVPKDTGGFDPTSYLKKKAPTDESLATTTDPNKGIGAVSFPELRKLAQAGKTEVARAPVAPTKMPSALYAPISGFLKGASSSASDEIAAGLKSAMPGEERTYEQLRNIERDKQREAQQEHPFLQGVGEVAGGILSPLARATGGPIGSGVYGGIEGIMRSEEEGIGGQFVDGLTGAIVGVGSALGLKTAGKILKKISGTRVGRTAAEKSKRLTEYLAKRFKSKAERSAVMRLEPSGKQYKELMKWGKTKFNKDGIEVLTGKERELGRAIIDEGILNVPASIKAGTTDEALSIMDNLLTSKNKWGKQITSLVKKHDMNLTTKTKLKDAVIKKMKTQYQKFPELNKAKLEEVDAILDKIQKDLPEDLTLSVMNDYKKALGNIAFNGGKPVADKEVERNLYFWIRDAITDEIAAKKGTDELAQAWSKYHLLSTAEPYLDNLFAKSSARGAKLLNKGMTIGGITGPVASGVLFQYHPGLAAAVGGIAVLSSLKRRFGKNMMIRYNERMSKAFAGNKGNIIRQMSSHLRDDPRMFAVTHGIMMKKSKEYRDAFNAMMTDPIEEEKKQPYSMEVDEQYKQQEGSGNSQSEQNRLAIERFKAESSGAEVF